MTLRLPPMSVCFILIGLNFGLLGCSDDDGDPGIVAVHLNHEVDGVALELNTGTYTNAAGNTYQVRRLEYILSDVRLETTGGKSTLLKDFHYADIDDAFSHIFTADRVAAGNYGALLFTFGIKSTDNVFGTLPNTPEYNNMEWPSPMGGGTARYHYMRLEGDYQSGNDSGSFLAHTGPSDGMDFSVPVRVPLALGIDGGEWQIDIVMNINHWFSEPNIYDFVGRAGIMGNADAQLVLQENGDNVFILDDIHDAHDEDHE